MVLRSCAHLTPFGQGAGHRRKVRGAFVLCLARPRKVLFFDRSSARGLASFFWSWSANKITVLNEDWANALHLQKNVLLFCAALLPKCLSGWSGSQALRPQDKAAKASALQFCFDGQRWHVRTWETNGTKCWPTHFISYTNLQSSALSAWECVGRVAT
jgi:hypothetical protein